MPVSSMRYRFQLPAILCCFFLVFTSNASEIDQARSLANEMEYDRAIRLLNKHLQKQPADQKALHLLAKIYSWNTQFDKSVATYDQLMKLAPDNPDYLFEKASALVWLNRIEDALPLLEKSWQQMPGNSEVWQLYILTLDRSDKPADKQRARELLKQAKQKFPDIHWDFI